MRLRRFLINEVKGTKEDFAIKNDLKILLGDKIKFNSKIKWHIRSNVGDDPKNFFNRYGYNLEDTSTSLSGQYTTYRLSKEGLGSTFFVNTLRYNSSINTKELTPEKLNIIGININQQEIIKTVERFINLSNYQKNIKEYLLELLEKSKNKGDKINIKSLDIEDAEKRTISNDFGEVLCAIWSISNIGFKEVFFPVMSNEPLLDFYGIRGKLKYPVSVKSAAGSATSLKNIINLILLQKDKNDFTERFTKRQQILIELIVNIVKLPVIEGFIMGHKILKTKAIKELSKITKTSIEDINEQLLNTWLQNKTSKELKVILQPLYKLMKNYPDVKTWGKYDNNDLTKPIGIIMGPMGHNLVKILNLEENLSTLSDIARKIILLQINISINKDKMIFKRDKFKNFTFKFSWQGGAPNPDRNKLGFKVL